MQVQRNFYLTREKGLRMENTGAQEIHANKRHEETNTVPNQSEDIKTDEDTAVSHNKIGSALFSHFADLLTTQNNLLKDIQTKVDSRLSYDTAKEKAIDKLSEELKLYRDNFIFQSQKPLFIELIMLYDNMVQILSYLGDHQEMTQEAISTTKNNVHNIKEELLEILYRRDVIPFEEHPENLDYKIHKTVSTITTSVESENNKIEKIVKTGFRWNEKVLRPEEVIIKKYSNAHTQTGDK